MRGLCPLVFHASHVRIQGQNACMPEKQIKAIIYMACISLSINMSASSFVQFIVGLLETFLLKAQASLSTISLLLVRFWSKSSAKSYSSKSSSSGQDFLCQSLDCSPLHQDDAAIWYMAALTPTGRAAAHSGMATLVDHLDRSRVFPTRI